MQQSSIKPIFFTPGPAQLYPGYEAFMQAAIQENVGSISHRSQSFMDLYQHTTDHLRALLQVPNDWQIFFMSSATEVWERLIQNCVAKTSFHFVNGSFSQRFRQISKAYGKDAQSIEVHWGEGFAPANAQISQAVELISFTQNETSTGVMTSFASMQAVRKQFPDALITVDMVSSAPYAQPDFNIIDACYFSVQKCFGLPAGLGVLLLNEKCLQKSQKLAAEGQLIGSYHSFDSLLQKALKYQTPETPNVTNIFLLGKVCESMLNKGVDIIREETEEKARMIYGFLESNEHFEPFVNHIAHRSRTVAVANVHRGSGELLQAMAAKGLVLGNGYGKMKGQQIRIANFPAISVGGMGRLLVEMGDYFEN